MNEFGKTVDTTFLSIEQAEKRGFLHRDYIAHCFRWSHVIKRLMQSQRHKTAHILDIGCGRELPFAKTLYSSKMVPISYVGIDAGKILPEALEAVSKGKMGEATKIFANTCFSSKWATDYEKMFTDIICFECAEHVEPEMLKDMLDGMLHVLHITGRVWISTPCWDYRSCAANHVNEMTYGAFGAMCMEAGFIIENVHGTFASISDYKHKMSPAYAEVFEDLRDYYDSNVLSVIFAPMFPAQSRNALWELRKPRPGEKPNFDQLCTMQKPWGSSAHWESMARENWKDNWPQ
jgi:2-polyprenyl-3-methyl-5-hydroxy-6-metoxy-1,4-benzoquinol methylase